MLRDSYIQVLDEVRPYLVADGGNVRVMGVDTDTRVVSAWLSVFLFALRCTHGKTSLRTSRSCSDDIARNRYAHILCSTQVKLALQGACGSCPSSTTTMKMGIERVLNENFLNMGGVSGNSMIKEASESTAVLSELSCVESGQSGMVKTRPNSSPLTTASAQGITAPRY